MNTHLIFNQSWQFIETTYNFIFIYPDIFLIGILSISITYLVILDYFFKNKFILNNIAKALTIVSLVIAGLLSYNNYLINLIGFQSLFININYNNFVQLIIIGTTLFIILLSLDYFRKEKIIHFEYFILSLLALLGLFMLVYSYDLLSLYLAIELQSLCFYILTTLKPYTNFSSEAGIKYFILGAFSSGLLLFGSSILYGFTGLTDFYNLELLFQNQGLSLILTNGCLIGFIFIIAGLLFKLAAAPFHTWAPDVYEGSPTIITTFFAIIPKIAIITLFSRVIIYLLNQHIFYFNQFLIFSGVLSLFIGTFGALYQKKIKRLLAYSGISHVGFILISLSIISIESFFSFFFLCINLYDFILKFIFINFIIS